MLIIATLILVVAWAAFWPWIRLFLESRLIPTVRELFGEKAAEWVADFTIWLDDHTTALRRFSKEAWRFLQTRVLRIQSRYTKLSATTAKKETESYYHTDDGKVLRRVETETVAWEHLSEKIRSEMIRLNKKESQVDVRDALLKKAGELAADQGILVEIAG